MRVFWPLLSLLALLLLSQSFASSNSGTQTGNENTVTVCEYQYSNLSSLNTTLSCPPNYSLQINWVNYGRLNESVCSANGFNDVTSCSYDGLSLVGSLCDGLQSCTFTPGYYFFGSNDPCPGYIKYTTIYYSCLPGTCTPVESGSSDNTVTWRYVYAQNNLTSVGNTTSMPDPPSDANQNSWYFPSFMTPHGTPERHLSEKTSFVVACRQPRPTFRVATTSGCARSLPSKMSRSHSPNTT